MGRRESEGGESGGSVDLALASGGVADGAILGAVDDGVNDRESGNGDGAGSEIAEGRFRKAVVPHLRFRGPLFGKVRHII